MTVEQLKQKTVLSQQEFDQLSAADAQWAQEYLFHNFWNNTYLNLSVYSEVDKEEHDLRVEQGF